MIRMGRLTAGVLAAGFAAAGCQTTGKSGPSSKTTSGPAANLSSTTASAAKSTMSATENPTAKAGRGQPTLDQPERPAAWIYVDGKAGKFGDRDGQPQDPVGHRRTRSSRRLSAWRRMVRCLELPTSSSISSRPLRLRAPSSVCRIVGFRLVQRREGIQPVEAGRRFHRPKLGDRRRGARSRRFQRESTWSAARCATPSPARKLRLSLTSRSGKISTPNIRRFRFRSTSVAVRSTMQPRSDLNRDRMERASCFPRWWVADRSLALAVPLAATFRRLCLHRGSPIGGRKRKVALLAQFRQMLAEGFAGPAIPQAAYAQPRRPPVWRWRQTFRCPVSPPCR